MTEIKYPWQDWPDIPDPPEVKKCRVNKMTGVSIERYTDYGPFRRCGCRACLLVVKRYDGVSKAERKNPRAVTLVRASHGSGIPTPTGVREAIVVMLSDPNRKLTMQEIGESFGVSRSAVQRISKVMRDGCGYS